jgi:hypothetical protein
MEADAGLENEGTATAERARLEIERLRAEVTSLQRSNSWRGAMERNVAFLAAFLTAAGIGIGLIQFNKQQQANREQSMIQAERDDVTRMEELKKAYWQEQKNTYAQGSLYAGLIASASSLKEVANETRQFFGLYWGPMSLLEHSEVERSMIDFGRALTAWQQSGKKPENIENLSYQLAHCMKQSLGKTWRPVTGESIRDKKCPYE